MRAINLVLAIVTALAVGASVGNAAPLQGKHFRTTYSVQDNGNSNGSQQDRFKVSY